MIEPIRDERGFPRAKAVCDDCGRDECFPASHDRQRGGKSEAVNEGQVVRKAQAQGWSYVKNKLRCPSCEAKRKVVPMTKTQTKQDPVSEAPREPTKEQKRAIIDMLREVYDTEAERYSGGDSAETVADVLSVMPGWVAQIRDDLFGPDGGNADMDRLAARIAHTEKAMADLDTKAADLRREADDMAKQAQGQTKTLADLKKELAAIKVAVGPRAMRRAGVA